MPRIATTGLSRHNIRHDRALFAGSFVALALGVALIALTTMLIWSASEVLAGLGPDEEELATALDDLLAMLGVMAGFSGFMAVFVVASTFGFAVTARQREIGLLSLVGGSRRQVRRMIRGESLVVAVLASVVGCALGWALAPAALWLLSRRGLAPDGLSLSSPWGPFAIASGVGIVVAFLGAWAAARRAARIPAIQALHEAGSDRGRIGPVRLLVGLVCLGGAVAMLLGTRAGNPELALVLSLFVPQAVVVGLVCWGPVLMPALVRLLTLGLRRHVLLDLAAKNVIAQPRRTTSLAAPILAISGIAGTVILSLSFAADWEHGITTQQLRTPVVVTGDGEAGAALESREDVALADGGLLLPIEGDLADLTGRTVAVSRGWAWDHGTALGRRLPVRFGDGTRARLRVVAIVDDAYQLQQPVLVPRRLAERHGGEPSGTWFVRPTDETTAEALIARLGTDLPDLSARAAAGWAAEQDTRTRDENTLGMVLVLGPSGVYAALAIANTLLMGSLQRRHEFVATRLVGATERQVRRLVVAEAGLVSAVALLLGLATTVAVAVLLRAPMTAGLADVPLTIPWTALLSIVAACVLVAVVSAVAPARAMLRRATPAQSLG